MTSTELPPSPATSQVSATRRSERDVVRPERQPAVRGGERRQASDDLLLPPMPDTRDRAARPVARLAERTRHAGSDAAAAGLSDVQRPVRPEGEPTGVVQARRNHLRSRRGAMAGGVAWRRKPAAPRHAVSGRRRRTGGCRPIRARSGRAHCSAALYARPQAHVPRRVHSNRWPSRRAPPRDCGVCAEPVNSPTTVRQRASVCFGDISPHRLNNHGPWLNTSPARSTAAPPLRPRDAALSLPCDGVALALVVRLGSESAPSMALAEALPRSPDALALLLRPYVAE